MKKIIILIFILLVAPFVLAPKVASAGDFSLGGYIEAGFFPPGNEFNPPGTIYGPQKILTHVARYALRGKIKIRYKKFFILYEPKLYLGDSRPGQCRKDGNKDCQGQSYNAPPLVYYHRLDFGVFLTGNTEIYVETGRTFWPSPDIARGDHYMYSGVFVRYTFGDK